MSATSPIKITNIAAEKLREILSEENGQFLRVYVQGGGCSGFQYGLTTSKIQDENDSLFESNGIKLVIDPISICYIKGSEISWEDNITGGTFTFKNPNAKSTCGCGQSFKP